jgi:hypothetical protein
MVEISLEMKPRTEFYEKYLWLNLNVPTVGRRGSTIFTRDTRAVAREERGRYVVVFSLEINLGQVQVQGDATFAPSVKGVACMLCSKSVLVAGDQQVHLQWSGCFSPVLHLQLQVHRYREGRCAAEHWSDPEVFLPFHSKVHRPFNDARKEDSRPTTGTLRCTVGNHRGGHDTCRSQHTHTGTCGSAQAMQRRSRKLLPNQIANRPTRAPDPASWWHLVWARPCHMPCSGEHEASLPLRP